MCTTVVYIYEKKKKPIKLNNNTKNTNDVYY